MLWWLRTDGRVFGIVFVLFNILLAVFNIFTYKVASRATVPCVVIVAPTPPPTPLAEDPRMLRPTVLSSSSSSFTTGSTANGSTTPHTRRVTFNATAEEVTTLLVNVTSQWDTEIRDKYTVVRRYIPAEGPEPGFNNSVTLSTQGTYEFLHHVTELCERWEGPVSVSVYAPGTDLPVALRKVHYLRRCGPPCVARNVTWHLVYDTVMGPRLLGTPYEEAEMDGYEPLNCSAGEGPLNLISEIRKSKKMPYPINVARNVARQESRTHFVLASDIELYPSLHIVPRFLRLVASLSSSEDWKGKLRVFTLPIFEVKKEFQAPKTKSEITKRVKGGQAIFFHKWVCDACQNFPKRDEWLRTLPVDEDSLGVFETTKRQTPRTAWEPIYIGTNAEPLYNEGLTWEGKRDKMSQMYEMCLLDYDFCVLDNAFLVHAPGIKTLNSQDQKRRAPFMYKNNALHNKLLASMKKKYGPRKGC